MSEHTPTPWSLKRSTVPHDGEYDFSINAADVRVLGEVFGRDADGGRPPAEANAAFIVKAVNSHDELVAALTALNNDKRLALGATHRKRIAAALSRAEQS